MAFEVLIVIDPINVMMGDVHTHFLLRVLTLPNILNILVAHWVR